MFPRATKYNGETMRFISQTLNNNRVTEMWYIESERGH